jgi:uncharacterized protein (DUF433 family)
MNWQDRITAGPAVCHGKACIKGTRVMVSVILDNLAAGESIDEVMQGYHLERDDIQAAIHYAADLARETVVPFTPGAA